MLYQVMSNISRNFSCFKTDITGKKYLIGEIILYPNGQYDFNFINNYLVQYLKWSNVGNDEFSLAGLRGNYLFFKIDGGFWKSIIEGHEYYLLENYFK